MSTAFDPYHKWLGIPPAEQPPHHYRLLGLALFESDGDVIEIAADQRMALLRSFHTGPHSDLSQKLLNEVAAARLCLLRPDRRQRYDEGLRQRLAQPAAQPTAASQTVPGATPAKAPAAATATTTAAARAFASEFDLLDEPPAASKAMAPNPAPAPAPVKPPAAKPAPAGSGLSGIGKSAAPKNDSIELVGKSARRAKPADEDDLELLSKPAKKPQADTLELVGKPAKKSREIELAPRSSAWDQAIADACSTQSVVYRRRRRWHIDTRVIQIILFIAFIAGLAYAGSIGVRMYLDSEFKKTNLVKAKSSPPPPPPTTTATSGTTSTEDSQPDQKNVEPVRPQPAFGGGRNFTEAPADANHQPNETTPNPSRDPSQPTQPASNGSDSAPPAKSPVPSSEEQKKALQEINQVFKEDIRLAGGVINQVQLAHKFARVASDTKDPVMRYALATEALEMATRLGDVELASWVVGGLATNYQIDGWELKYRTLTLLARSARSPRREVAVAAYGMVEEAMAEGHFDHAIELATLSMNMASSIKNAPLREQAREMIDRIKFIQKESKAFETANAQLAADPEDRSANLVVGKYLCYVKHDWDAGLPHLAKGADDILRSLAERDQNHPADTDKQMGLADDWWSLADQRQDPKNDFESKALRSRTSYWYRQAMPKLSGFLLEKAQRRANE